MTHVCCPSCRLRFNRAAAATLTACPQCGEPPHAVFSAELALGLRLYVHDDRAEVDAPSETIAVALEAALTTPRPKPS
jgi:hypothetical protein